MCVCVKYIYICICHHIYAFIYLFTYLSRSISTNQPSGSSEVVAHHPRWGQKRWGRSCRPESANLDKAICNTSWTNRQIIDKFSRGNGWKSSLKNLDYAYGILWHLEPGACLHHLVCLAPACLIFCGMICLVTGQLLCHFDIRTGSIQVPQSSTYCKLPDIASPPFIPFL